MYMRHFMVFKCLQINLIYSAPYLSSTYSLETGLTCLCLCALFSFPLSSTLGRWPYLISLFPIPTQSPASHVHLAVSCCHIASLETWTLDPERIWIPFLLLSSSMALEELFQFSETVFPTFWNRDDTSIYLIEHVWRPKEPERRKPGMW